jgi:hypothetical protein
MNYQTDAGKRTRQRGSHAQVGAEVPLTPKENWLTADFDSGSVGFFQCLIVGGRSSHFPFYGLSRLS